MCIRDSYKYFVGCGVAQIGTFTWQSNIAFGLGASFGLGPRVGFEIPFTERFAVFGFGEVLFSPARAVLKFNVPDPTHPEAPVANTQWTQPLASGFFAVGLAVKFK